MPIPKPNGHSNGHSLEEWGRALAAAGHAAVDEGERHLVKAREVPRLPPPTLPAPPPQSHPDDGTLAIDQLIETAVNHVMRSRLIPAGLALVQVKQIYQARDSKTYPPEQRTWQGFCEARVPMGFKRIEQCIGRVSYNGAALACSECGTVSVAHCDCGAVYVSEHPWAHKTLASKTLSKPIGRAVAAIEAHPNWSNRKIAADIRVSLDTVNRARRHLTAYRSLDRSPIEHEHKPSITTTTTSKKPPNLLALQEPLEGDVTLQQRWEWSLGLIAGDAIAMAAYWDKHFPGWQKLRCSPETNVLIGQAIAAFQALQVREESTLCEERPSQRPSGSITAPKARRSRSGGTSSSGRPGRP